MVELAGSEPIVNTPPYLWCHPMEFCKKEQFWLEEHRQRVRGYAGIPGHEEPHKLCGSTKTRCKCVEPRAGCNRACVPQYAKMMWYSIYPGVFHICILPVAQSTSVVRVSPWTIPPPTARVPCQCERWWWEIDFPTTTVFHFNKSKIVPISTTTSPNLPRLILIVS